MLFEPISARRRARASIKRYGVLGLLLSLGGCAHAPQVSVLQSPTGLPDGLQFELAADDPAGRAVGSALVANGFRPAAPGEVGRVVVQAGFAEKPRGVGARPGEAGDDEWLTRGAPARPWTFARTTYVLSVAIHDPGGHELFRSYASKPVRKDKVEETLAKLAAAAVAPLKAQAAASPGG